MNRLRDRRWPGVGHRRGEAALSNWPGQVASLIQASALRHWVPTGIGPGEGPDLRDSSSKYGSLTDSDLISHSEILCRYEIDSAPDASEARQARRILQNRIDQLCPSCGYARLKIDAELHISCPICGFGVHRQPER